MQPGEILASGKRDQLANGRYRFIYQGDTNLVLYARGTHRCGRGTPAEASRRGCVHHAGRRQSGRLRPEAASRLGVRYRRHPGSRLVVQDDGNVVIYRPDGTPVWATDTWRPTGPRAQGDDMQPGEVLDPDSSITSANGRYTLRLPGRRQPGALRRRHAAVGVRHRRPAAWVCASCRATATSSSTTPGGQPIWSSGTWQHPGSRLVVQDDGNVVIYRPDGTPVWATEHLAADGPDGAGRRHAARRGARPGQLDHLANGRYTLRLSGRRQPGALRRRHAAVGVRHRRPAVGVCIMQGDGNLVVYAPRRPADLGVRHLAAPGQPPGRPGRRQRRDLPPGRHTGMGHRTPGCRPGRRSGRRHAAGRGSDPGQSITPPTAATGSSIRATATWCSTTAGTPLWASGTDGQPVGVCIMQGDGNLVVYAPRRPADLGVRHRQHPGQPAGRPGRRQCGDLPPGRHTGMGHQHPRSLIY